MGEAISEEEGALDMEQTLVKQFESSEAEGKMLKPEICR